MSEQVRSNPKLIQAVYSFCDYLDSHPPFTIKVPLSASKICSGNHRQWVSNVSLHDASMCCNTYLPIDIFCSFDYFAGFAYARYLAHSVCLLGQLDSRRTISRSACVMVPRFVAPLFEVGLWDTWRSWGVRKGCVWTWTKRCKMIARSPV